MKHLCARTSDASGLEFARENETPQQNGVAEKFNETLEIGITASLLQANLPGSFWEEAANVFLWTHQRAPTSSVKGMTPYEAFYGRKPSVANARIFGSRAWVHIAKKKRTRSFQAKATACIFIGHTKDYHAWSCFDPVTKLTHSSRDVIFDESIQPGLAWSKADTEYVPVIPQDTSPSPPTLPASPATLASSSPSPSTVPKIFLSEDTDSASEVDDAESLDEVPPLPIFQPNRLPYPSPSPTPARDIPLPPSPTPEHDIPLPPSPSSTVITIPSPAETQPRRSTRQVKPVDRNAWQNSIAIPKPEPQATQGEASPSAVTPGAIPFPTIQDTEQADAVYSDEEMDAALSAFIDCASWQTERMTYTDREYIEFAFAVLGLGRKVPRGFAEAMKRDDKDLWLDAFTTEYNALMANETWELVELPEGRKAIDNRWVCTIKEHADGSIDRYKARLVAKGYLQIGGLEYGETWSPTAKMTALRICLAIAALEDYEIDHLDISNAFTNSKISYEVYMKQPKGFEVVGKEHFVCKMLRTLYGLKQGPHDWYHTLNDAFREEGFQRITSDPAV